MFLILKILVIHGNCMLLISDELADELDDNFDSWDLPVDWRLQKAAKQATNLGPSMGIRFPLFRSLSKPETIERRMAGGKRDQSHRPSEAPNVGTPINLMALGASDYAFRKSMDCLKFLPKHVSFCIQRWYSDVVSLDVS
jgi:hypothetical protein